MIIPVIEDCYGAVHSITTKLVQAPNWQGNFLKFVVCQNQFWLVNSPEMVGSICEEVLL